jgi:hypothetical protein
MQSARSRRDLPNKHPIDGPSHRAAVALHAHETLVTAVEEMKISLGLNRDANSIAKAIKEAMNVELDPYGFTVVQTLCERERSKALNQNAADDFPEVRQQFEDAIRELLVAREGRAVGKRVRKIAGNAWKEDPAADRRIRETEHLPPDQFRSPYKGQPELYDPRVVAAFEAAVARAIGRSHVSWTRGTNDNKSSGVILKVFVAAVQWAMCVAWQCSAPPGTKPVEVKAEGLLRVVKAKRRKNSAD